MRRTLKEAALSRAEGHLRELCAEIEQRYVGGQGNLQATEYAADVLASAGLCVEKQRFAAFDWRDESATLTADGEQVDARMSPYSPDCDVAADLVFASTEDELREVQAAGQILVLRGALASEQLMPKGFVFYNPERHQRLVAALEASGARALVFIVDEAGEHEGGDYPFPIIEDGDFGVPSVYTTQAEGAKLLDAEHGRLVASATRSESHGFNIIARTAGSSDQRVVVSAHIDAKRGVPGALDNATGVVTQLLLAELLSDYAGRFQVELAVLNGEDYYSVPGQMTYLEQGGVEGAWLNINVDGVGLEDSKTAVSMLELPVSIRRATERVIADHVGLVRGEPWYQGDHSIFLQHGVPAVAISSKWLLDNLATQSITHTPDDRIEIVDVERLVELAHALRELLEQL
ncbi:MAG: M28 family peptidase [Myxococcota bacterium]